MSLSLSLSDRHLLSLCKVALIKIAFLFILAACVINSVQAQSEKEQSTKEPFRFGEVDLEYLEQISQLDKNFEKQGLIYKDAALTEYVERVGKSLLAADSTLENVTWKFRVFRDPVANAFALPNGSIYIHTGLLALLENESQLAGILAHEIIHVRNRHGYLSYRSYRKKMVAAHVIAAIGGFSGLAGTGLSIAAEFALSLTIVGYSRELEKEADLEGLKIVLNSSYDPREVPGAFKTLQKKFEVDLDRDFFFFYNDHPKLQDRVTYTSEVVAKSPEKKFSDEALAEMKERYLKNCEEVTRHNIQLDIEKGLYRTALAHARKLKEFHPDSADNIVSLANAYTALGPRTPEPAEEELTGKGKKVARKMKNKLTLDEQEKELLASPGGQERQKQNYAEAEKLYKQALEIDAGNAQAYRGLGVLMEKMQNAQAAVDAYRRYVELKPDAMDRLQIIRRVKTLEAKLSTTDSQPSQK